MRCQAIPRGARCPSLETKPYRIVCSCTRHVSDVHCCDGHAKDLKTGRECCPECHDRLGYHCPLVLMGELDERGALVISPEMLA